MPTVLSRLALAALICASLVSSIFAGPAEGPAPKEAEEEEEQPNEELAEMMLKMYAEGEMKVMYAVALHAYPKAGQLWKTTTISKFGDYEQKASELWQVSKVEGKQALVENRNSSYGIIIAYLVDTTVTGDEIWKKGNVRKAWVGKKSEAPKEAEVMEVYKPEGGEEAQPPEKNYAETSEAFKDLEIAGRKWSGKKTTMKMNDGSFENTIWTAENGWFSGVLKMDYKMESGTMTQELTRVSSSAKPLLKWDGIKFEEEKKEEKKEGEKEGSK